MTLGADRSCGAAETAVGVVAARARCGVALSAARRRAVLDQRPAASMRWRRFSAAHAAAR
jgi:hypothetical protein